MLNEILLELVAEQGLKTSSVSERTLAITRINRAAKEIYDMGDLYGSVSEGIFDFNTETSQVSLPDFVGHVRGMRYYDNRLTVPLDVAGNRYHDAGGNEVWYLKFREKDRSPLARAIENQSTLSFNLPFVEATDVKIYIQGPTYNSAKFSETVTIVAGQLSANSVGNYKSPLASLRKDSITKYDIIVNDAEDNELARIPNHQYESVYQVYQIFDTQFSSPGGDELCLEVLYKKKFVPFKNDSDEFVAGSDYDKAIVWKYLEHRAKDAKDAILLRAKCAEIVRALNEDAKVGKRQKINFVPGPWFDCSDLYAGNTYGSW